MSGPRYRAASASRPVPLGDILTNVVSRLGLQRNLDDYRVWAAWDEVVGDAVARNAQPSRLDARRLVVTVKNATWMQELTLLRQDLCRRLNDWMGREVVSELFFVIGRVEREPHRAARPRRHPEDTETAAARPADVDRALERLWQAVRERDQS